MSNLKFLAVVCLLSLLVAPFQSISPSLVLAQETAFVFTRDLESGMTGADVKELQQYLNAHGFLVAPAGKPGSPGNETEKFGAATFSALKTFQAASGISPASGYFGPLTRQFISGNASATATNASSSGSGSVSVGSSSISASDYQKLKAELFNEFKALLTKQSDVIVDSSARSTSAVSDSVSSLSESVTTDLNLLSASTTNALNTLQSGITSSQWTTGDDGSISYDGNVTIGTTLPGATLGGTVAAWNKYTIASTNAAFTAAATTISIPLAALPANVVIEGRRLKHSVAFTGTGLTAMTCSLGDDTSTTAYSPPFNVMQSVTATAQSWDGGAYSSTADAHNLLLTCTANTNFGDGSETVLTTGSLTIHIKAGILQ